MSNIASRPNLIYLGMSKQSLLNSLLLSKTFADKVTSNYATILHISSIFSDMLQLKVGGSKKLTHQIKRKEKYA